MPFQIKFRFMLVINSDLPQAIPSKTNMSETDPDMSTDYHPLLESVLQEHRAIFRQKLGHTSVAEHVIETGNALPVKVLARPILFQGTCAHLAAGKGRCWNNST